MIKINSFRLCKGQKFTMSFGIKKHLIKMTAHLNFFTLVVSSGRENSRLQ